MFRRASTSAFTRTPGDFSGDAGAGPEEADAVGAGDIGICFNASHDITLGHPKV